MKALHDTVKNKNVFGMNLAMLFGLSRGLAGSNAAAFQTILRCRLMGRVFTDPVFPLVRGMRRGRKGQSHEDAAKSSAHTDAHPSNVDPKTCYSLRFITDTAGGSGLPPAYPTEVTSNVS
jgi:hypothetical protein